MRGRHSQRYKKIIKKKRNSHYAYHVETWITQQSMHFNLKEIKTKIK